MSWLEQEESPAAAVSLVPLVEKPIALPLLLLLHLLVLVHVQVPRPASLLTTREAAAAEDGDDLLEEKRRVEAENLKIITMPCMIKYIHCCVQGGQCLSSDP